MPNEFGEMVGDALTSAGDKASLIARGVATAAVFFPRVTKALGTGAKVVLRRMRGEHKSKPLRWW
jgi:hypothetical protein